MKVIAFIGMGSNLDGPEEQIRRARITIREMDGVRECAFSSLYLSSPMGPQNQPDYVNAVMAIETELPAIQLLRKLQEIEEAQGRVRKGERWGARIMDLDLLLYADQKIDVPDLIVPHYGIAERAFVLVPLHEIAPGQEIPGLGSVTYLMRKCPLNGLTKAGR